MTAETLNAEQQLDQAISELGTLEVKGSQRWIYFSDLMDWLQLEIERDENGNVLSATLGGEDVVAKRAIMIENQIKRARLYYDLDDRVFRGQGLDSTNREALSKAVIDRAEQMLAETGAGSTEDDAGDEA